MARNHLEDLLTDVSFVRWIRGEATSEEERTWNSWLQEDPDHQHLVEEANRLVTTFQNEENEIPDISNEWQRLDKLIDQEERLQNPLQRRKGRSSMKKSRSLAIAALLMIGISLGTYFIFQYQLLEDTESELASSQSYKQEYRTDYGEKATFRLSDDSRIVLNANSRVRFLSGVEEEQSITEVWLEGEAWFDITHFEGERRRIFTVHTDDGSVEVLGTRFAVKTLGEETRTVLEEGKIQIRTRQTNRTRQTGGTPLQPGEMALYSAGRPEVDVENVNPRVYTSWSEDIWFFEDTPVEEVVRRIEDTFGIEVMIQEDLIQRKLSGSIKGTSIDVLAEALARILDVEIEKRDQALHIE